VFWLPFALLSGQNVVAEVPFEFFKQEVVAQVQICGKGPFAVMFDTGAAPSVIDLTLARQLGIKLESNGAAGDGGGSEKTQAYDCHLPDLELGGLTIKGVDCVAMYLSNLSKKLGRHLDGLVCTFRLKTNTCSD
jgi:hypothetical protein